MPQGSRQALNQLAALYGIQTAYYDAAKRRQQAPPASLLAVLQLLGASVTSLADVPSALRERRQALWGRGLDPVTVVWDHAPATLSLRLTAADATGVVTGGVQREQGGRDCWHFDLSSLPTSQVDRIEGVSYVTKLIPLPSPLPPGYHQCSLDRAGQRDHTLLMVAPRYAYVAPATSAPRAWGVFLPLYALHAQRSWGGGDFTDLEALATWVGEQGGGVVGTLPMLSAFLDDPYDPSPYAPASRLFWNEFYIDVTRAPGLQESPTARALLRAVEVQESIETLQASPLVDYRRQMALKRQILEALARTFYATMAPQHAGFHDFLATTPSLEEYARFRATGERQRRPWPAWPAPLRDGTLREGDYDEEARRYHLYVQWVAHTQLTALAARSKAAGVRLYLDLPLGVHAYSYDVWRQRTAFALGAAGGSPPDPFFTKGQNWGFPPLHPETIREQGYRYCIAYLRHQLRHCGLLRIDHVMGLHRLFWIPAGFEASQGVYVRYAAEEFYALVNIESHRHQVGIIGENLGTVPGYVNQAMARHRLQRMYVVQYELTPAPRPPLRAVPPHTIASLNTHDMPPFAAYWQCLDIEEQLAQGLLNAAGARRARAARRAVKDALCRALQQQGLLPERSPDTAAILRACLAFLSASPAHTVLVNLEDLWLESEPQNFPNTGNERPNWRRKAQYSLEHLRQMPQVLTILQTVNQLRQL